MEHQELIPDKRIVQSWRASDWPDGNYSQGCFRIGRKGGDYAPHVHTKWSSRRPVRDYSQGWCDYYWEPMKDMLEKD